MYQQDPPFCVQVEMTEGCNRRCAFCGLSAIRGKANDFKFLTVELANTIASGIAQAGWTSRIEFAMHGEPTINPKAALIIAIFRQHLPKNQLMMTSNGGGLVKDVTKQVDALFDAGLNILALDDYIDSPFVKKIRNEYKGAITVREYPRDPEGNPHRRRGRTEQLISLIADISEQSRGAGTHSLLNNHAGSGSPLNDRGKGKRCAKPFRELSIRWDGNVAICCNDWPGKFKVGRVAKAADVAAVWQDPKFMAARQMLVQGRREFAPCQGCDAISYRVGLLPDHKGLETLPEPDATTTKLLKKAIAGVSFTHPIREVLR